MNIKKIFSKRGLIFIKDLIIGFTSSISKKFKKKEVWIIAERYNEARDNGYHLFKYINALKNNKIECYYVIDKSSTDYDKIKKFGRTIQFGSIKHHIYYWKASKLISTHINGFIPNEKAYYYIHKSIKHSGKKVFLQHGITKDDLPQLYYEKTNLNLFVCGAKPEFDYVDEKFGYPKGIVKYLGLCRFDNLMDFKVQNKILVMPTFRLKFFLNKDEKITKEKMNEFINSEYYKTYYNLLTDKRIIRKLNEKNLEIIFYPHYEMQKYISVFKDIPYCVKIADRKNYDIQELLKISKLLITDFSSVFFDFAYMKKPIIYYQFDQEEYRNNHYVEGYFKYEKNGFGPVINEYNKLIDEVLRCIDSEFTVEKKYLNRQKEFFVYNDRNNCKRNYDAIKKI